MVVMTLRLNVVPCDAVSAVRGVALAETETGSTTATAKNMDFLIDFKCQRFSFSLYMISKDPYFILS